MSSLLSHPDEISAIEFGTHSNPFAFLGLHPVEYDGKSGFVVRVFRPDADQIFVLEGKKEPKEMEKVTENGFFHLFFGGRKKEFDYQLEILVSGKPRFVTNDPFRYRSIVSDFDLQLWGEGNHHRAYEFMGAHPRTIDGVHGVHFVVSAPSAARVSVVGAFNNWDGRIYPMRKLIEQGIWEIFIPGLEEDTIYKYEIKSSGSNIPFLKADPYGFFSQNRPATASIIKSVDSFKWEDESWMESRTQLFDKPVSVYEVHLGSWKRHLGSNEFYTYRELADELIPYCTKMGFTHLELLPISEHPYDPSWGYQVTGYFAPTSRFGSPEDFAYFVNECHKNNLGVILDWVPAHFTKDDHGLRQFDGTALYEHEDPRQGEHKDWGTKIFNFGRNEVKNFLISNACFWLDKYHIDGLRVDAVASMLYLDYSRKEGEWIPNKFGGRENLEAIDFLKRFNEVVHKDFTGVITMAEESTSWPMVSKPTYIGGLGFDYKWNMGWMNDTLKYFQTDPLFRKYQHNQLTFSFIYAFSENFVLPFSHDEVVHMKKSMLDKMPGDVWQKFANLRSLYTYMFAHPGKKLNFMGGEFGQWSEWTEAKELNWSLVEMDKHAGLLKMFEDLNALYKNEPSLYEVDFDWSGFQWIDFSDVDNSIIAFLRFSADREEFLVCAFNLTPVYHKDYIFGVPEAGVYKTIFNSDSEHYGGSNKGVDEVLSAQGEWHGHPHHIKIDLPPLAGIYMKLKKEH
ncbi:MAG: 1,4-alpha-glucan branching protein GlgB [Balneolales bacterium]|nr:1,4-alpha-glucan branching protein GlgB [Balneolales bacterium]